MTSAPAVAQAHEARLNGDQTLATARCLEALREDPHDVEALTLLGTLTVDSGASFAGVALLERARALAPDDHTVLVALADAQDAAGDSATAEALFGEATAAAPDSVAAWTTWGRFLLFAGRTDESLEALAQAVRVGPEYAEGHLALSSALFVSGALEPATEAFRRALQLRPDYDARPMNLASQLKSRGQPERAIAVLDHGLAMKPGDPELQYTRDALTGLGTHDRAPADYVALHFDRFASTFDSCLSDGLGYTVPETLVALVREQFGERDTASDVLDVGCGTGLCGPGLRPMARRLVGVDLSAGMLELADKRGVYDELICSDIVDMMHGAAGEYDLVIGADVYIYFGALDDVMSATACALRPAGVLAVSIESHDGTGYRLGPSGRWAHSLDALRRPASAAGLDEVRVQPTTLRMEEGAPVSGFLALFAKTS